MNFVRHFIGRMLRVLTAPVRFILNAPSIFLSAPRRLMGMTLPARVAVVVAICLAVVLIVHVVVLGIVSETFEARVWFRQRGLVAFSLLVTIPIVTYFMLKVWLQGETSRFSDIDAAWKAGMAALQEHGIDPREVPIFVVVGAATDGQIRSLFDASGLEFDVREVPRGRAPLRWFAHEGGVFLVLNNASLLSSVNSLALQRMSEGMPTPGQRLPQGIRGTLLAGGDADWPAAPSEPAGRPAPSDSTESDAGQQLRGTMAPGTRNIRQTLAPGHAPEAARGDAGRPALAKVGLSRQEEEEQSERLHYVCQLLNRLRQPYCPINGILTLLSVQVIEDITAARDVQDAVSGDLETVHESLQLCAPVVVMVVGMEAKGGFFELVRRVGMESRSRRFGKGFEVSNRSSEEQMDAFATHACGAFEDWVYHLFQEPGGLDKPGNGKLYNLLCEIRLRLRARIRSILVNAYGFEPSSESGTEQSFLFGGCYFAATGETDDRRAFVHDVFQRLVDLQDDVEWSSQALAANARFHRLAHVGMVLDGILLIALILLLIAWYFEMV